jgi:hypothetical protein
LKGFELVLHRKSENLFERRLLVCKVNASPFPNEWEVWKRFIQNVVSSQMWKNVFQVFELKVLEENSSIC